MSYSIGITYQNLKFLDIIHLVCNTKVEIRLKEI